METEAIITIANNTRDVLMTIVILFFLYEFSNIIKDGINNK
jgi:hypothetical protein